MEIEDDMKNWPLKVVNEDGIYILCLILLFHLDLLILTRCHTFLGKPKYEIVRNGNETQLISPKEV